MRIPVLVLVVGLAAIPLLRAECGRRASCEFHKEYGDDTGEDRYLNGVRYRVYRHSIAEKDEATGAFKTHEFLERCDPEATVPAARDEAAYPARPMPSPTPRLACPQRTTCDFHHEMGDDTGRDEYSGDVHYRVYTHSLAETDADGHFKQHELRLRCE